MSKKFVVSMAILALMLCAIPVQAQMPYPYENIAGTLEYQQPPAEVSGQPVSPAQVAAGQPVQGPSKQGPSAAGGASKVGRRVIAGHVSTITIESSGLVIISISGQAGGSFFFLLQSGDGLAAHQAILDLLEYAFDSGEEVNIGYGANNEIVAVEISR